MDDWSNKQVLHVIRQTIKGQKKHVCRPLRGLDGLVSVDPGGRNNGKDTVIPSPGLTSDAKPASSYYLSPLGCKTNTLAKERKHDN